MTVAVFAAHAGRHTAPHFPRIRTAIATARRPHVLARIMTAVTAVAIAGNLAIAIYLGDAYPDLAALGTTVVEVLALLGWMRVYNLTRRLEGRKEGHR